MKRKELKNHTYDAATYQFAADIFAKILGRDPEQYEASKNNLIQHLQAEQITYDEIEDKETKLLRFYLPSGRGTRVVVVDSSYQAEELCNTRLNKYIFLDSYNAVCSYEDKTIEARIEPLEPDGLTKLYEELFGLKFLPPDVNPCDISIEIDRVSYEPTCKLKIGPSSRHLNALIGISLTSMKILSTGDTSLTIAGLNISRHDQALAYLEKISDALFLQIDLKMGLALTLSRQREFVKRSSALVPMQESDDWIFPEYEYDQEPASLYWYARSAHNMPLLQYLAFYQAIEFYFPVYSQKEAAAKVKNTLKDPSFNKNRDADISRLIAIIRAGAGKSFGDERTQLRATIQDTIVPESLREFLAVDDERKEFLAREKKLSSHNINPNKEDTELKNDVADRIYDIRCKIVHTKSSFGDVEKEILLPFSKEANMLGYDLELIEFVARQVLVANGRQLSL